MSQDTLQVQVSNSPQVRRALLAGAVAGPLYVCVGTLEAVLRRGFDIRIHSLSLLANGSGGWIHSSMMVISGLLTVLGAFGLSRTQRTADVPEPSTQPSRELLQPVKRAARHSACAMIIGLVVYGLGIATAGLLRADPADGFPIGTPAGPPLVMTASGIGHLIAGAIGFLGLIVACLACARRSARAGDRVWAACSAVIGVYYLVAFAGIASGVGNPVINIAFTVAVTLGWGWVTALYLRAFAGKA